MKPRPEVPCPLCKRGYTSFPALSRYDNKTKICPECGEVEAFNTRRILVARKAGLTFDQYAGIMVRGYEKPIVKALLEATKKAKAHFAKQKRP